MTAAEMAEVVGPETAAVLVSVRDELRADVLDVVARHIGAQRDHLRAAQDRNRGEGQRLRDKHRWKMEALTALDSDLRRRWAGG